MSEASARSFFSHGFNVARWPLWSSRRLRVCAARVGKRWLLLPSGAYQHIATTLDNIPVAQRPTSPPHARMGTIRVLAEVAAWVGSPRQRQCEMSSYKHSLTPIYYYTNKRARPQFCHVPPVRQVRIVGFGA